MPKAAVAEKTIERLEATRSVEAWYEYPRSFREAAKTGHLEKLYDPDDPRWDAAVRHPQGALCVAIVTRIDGEVQGHPKSIMGGPIHENRAREFIRIFREKQAAGDLKPWDQDDTLRRQQADAKQAQIEGRKADAAMLREILLEGKS